MERHARHGLGRVEALQAHGPDLPLTDITEQQLDDNTAEFERINKELHIAHEPAAPEASRLKLRAWLTQTTMDWFDEFCQEGFDEDLATQLPDRWLACLFQFEAAFDQWIEAEILSWGQDCLSDVTDNLVDGAADLPRQQLLSRGVLLAANQRRLQDKQPQLFLHRPVRYGSANCRERALTAAHVPSLFEDQLELLQQTSKARWLDLPSEKSLRFFYQPQEKKLFIVAHIFSRRRSGNVHEGLYFWAGRRELHILELSLDTANFVEYGNHHHRSERRSDFCSCIRLGASQRHLQVHRVRRGQLRDTVSSQNRQPIQPRNFRGPFGMQRWHLGEEDEFA